MRHGSLFSGIGGFDLAAEWMGWDNVFHCEWNPFGQRNLKYHFPNAESFNDITKTDFKKYANKIDILTGGFPCQPYSSAGKRKGKEDERHLWPEMLRAIREISPRFVVGENVRGLTNWNGGMVFDEVCAELEALGYQVAPCIIPACGVDAPHRRERVWFVAYADSNARRCGPSESGCEERKANSNGESAIHFGIDTTSKTRDASDANSNGLNERNGEDEINTGQGRFNAQRDVESGNVYGITSDTLPIRLQQRENGGEMGGGQEEICRQGDKFTNGIEANGEIFDATNADNPRLQAQHNKKPLMGKANRIKTPCGNSVESVYTRQGWDAFPTQSPVCSGDDGLPTELDGITFSKWRAESVKAYGNAIVPQVAYQIFKAIQETDGI
jgi:DNA (cytosine-5)-methyltransferase 1